MKLGRSAVKRSCPESVYVIRKKCSSLSAIFQFADPASSVQYFFNPLVIGLADFQCLKTKCTSVLMDHVLIIDMQRDPVVGRHFLRQRCCRILLDFFQMTRTVHDLVKTDPVIAEQGSYIELGAEGRSIDPHFESFLLKSVDQSDRTFAKALGKDAAERESRRIFNLKRVWIDEEDFIQIK